MIAATLLHARVVACAVWLCSVSVAVAQTPSRPAPAAQNPSPMVETTRAHERLVARPFDGISRSFIGPADRAVELRIPATARGRASVDIVVHFHGAAWVAEQAVSALGDGTVAVVLNLGSGSGAYHRPFATAAVFDSLLASVARELAAALGVAPRIGRLTLSGWSAGHGAIRAIILEPRHFARVDAILLLDGMHTSYIPEGRVLSDSGVIDTTNLVALTAFARAAMRGEKRMLVTHSEIFPGTFASTTETADWMLASLGLRRRAVLQWGPRGSQQLSEVSAGGFSLLGFAGNTAPDHVDLLHGMPDFLARLWASSAAP
ncbi:MAG: hypothetical protein IT357_17195 [Gemmatimonadaceae bacterium]|nr:hypothetical protein [Gemmatimonadaceae bacterium]